MLTSGSAQEKKVGLDTKSGISKFKQAREYRRASKDAYRHAKVAFSCDLSYCISHYFLHRKHRTEAGTKPSLITSQAHPQDPVSFRLALTVYVNLTQPAYRAAHGHGLEDIYSRVLRTARALHRCKLSCKVAFPSSDREYSEEWAKEVWYEACMREGVYPDLLRRDEQAGLFSPLI